MNEQVLAKLDEIVATSEDEFLVQAARQKRAGLQLEELLEPAIEQDRAKAESDRAAADDERIRLRNFQTRLDPRRVMTQPSREEQAAQRRAEEAASAALAREARAQGEEFERAQRALKERV